MTSTTKTAVFNLHPLNKFESVGSTTIKRPKHFCEFSFNKKRQVQPLSNEALSLYYPPFFGAPGVPCLPIDLTKGYESWERSDDSVDNHLDALLQTLQVYEERLLQDGVTFEDARVKANVITWRGMMTKILAMLYDKFSDFEMNATCFQDTVFIEENHAYSFEQKQAEGGNGRPGMLPQDVLQYTGYKFETLSVIPRPWAEMTREEIEDRTNHPVDVNTQYCSIVQTAIGNTSLVLAGEVDCVIGEKPDISGHPVRWVELKTTGDFNSANPNETRSYEKKLLRYWAQSFLLGVPQIVVGLRSNNGSLKRIIQHETQRIPSQVAKGSKQWDGNKCIKSTADFLDFLRETIMGTQGVWRIRKARSSTVVNIFQIEETGTGDILQSDFKSYREKMLAADNAAKQSAANRSESNGDEPASPSKTMS